MQYHRNRLEFNDATGNGYSVMAGLDPAIHVLGAGKREVVDARVKPGA